MKTPTRQVTCEICGEPIISRWPETYRLEIKHNPECSFWNEGEEDKEISERTEYDLAH